MKRNNCYWARGPLDYTECYLCSDEVATANADNTQLIPIRDDSIRCSNNNCGAFLHRSCILEYAISLLKYHPFNPNDVIFPFYTCYEKLTTCQLCRVPNKNFCLHNHMYILNILNDTRIALDITDVRNHHNINILRTLSDNVERFCLFHHEGAAEIERLERENIANQLRARRQARSIEERARRLAARRARLTLRPAEEIHGEIRQENQRREHQSRNIY